MASGLLTSLMPPQSLGKSRGEYRGFSNVAIYRHIPPLIPVCIDHQQGRCLNMRCQRLHVPPPALPSFPIPLEAGRRDPLSAVPIPVHPDRFEQPRKMPPQPVPVVPLQHKLDIARSANVSTSSGTLPVISDGPSRIGTGLKRDQICQNHLKGRCQWGSKCHRKHVDPLESSPPNTPKEHNIPQIVPQPVAWEPLTTPPTTRVMLGPTGGETVADKDKRPQKLCSSPTKERCGAGSSCSDIHIFDLPPEPPSSSSLHQHLPPSDDTQLDEMANANEKYPTGPFPPRTKIIDGKKWKLTTPEDVCVNFSRRKCFYTNCNKRHLPYEELDTYFVPMVCRAWDENYCLRGDACPYTHAIIELIPELPSPPPENNATPSQPLRDDPTAGVVHSIKHESASQNQDTPQAAAPSKPSTTKPQNKGKQRATRPNAKATGKGSEHVPDQPLESKTPEPTKPVADSSIKEASTPQSSKGKKRAAQQPSINSQPAVTTNPKAGPSQQRFKATYPPFTSFPQTVDPGSSTVSSPHSTQSPLPDAKPVVEPEPTLPRPPHGSSRGKRHRKRQQQEQSQQPAQAPVASSSTVPQSVQAQSTARAEVAPGAPGPSRVAATTQQNPGNAPLVGPSQETLDAIARAPAVPPGLGLEKLLAAKEPPPPPRKSLDEISLSVLDGTKVTFGPGFEVRQLVTGFESRDVIIRKVPSSTTEEEIRLALEPFGEVSRVSIPEKKGSTMVVKASFTDHLHASQAVYALEGASIFGGDKLDITLGSHKSAGVGKGIVQDGDLCIEFPTPNRIGYVGFFTYEEADAAVKKMNGVVSRDCYITAEHYGGIPSVQEFTIRLLGLPPDTTLDELRKVGPDVMIQRETYKNLTWSLNKLYDILEQHGELEYLRVIPPPYVKRIVRAWARFKDPAAAASARRRLHNRPQWFIGKEIISVQHSFSIRYTIPRAVYRAISADISNLRQQATASDNHCNIETFDIGDGPSSNLVGVKLVAERMPTLARLKISFEPILKGDRLSRQGEPVWEPFFLRAEGQAFVKHLLSRYDDTRIEVNEVRRHITIYGSPGKRRSMRTALLTKIDQLLSLRIHVIPLEGKLIGLFMSVDLRKLQEELGMENVSLDLSNRVLRVRGNQEAYRTAQVAIHRAKYRHPDERSGEHGSCPVCLDDVTNPISLECGHSWCKSCLANFLRSSIDNKVFPLSCLGDEARCAKPISLQVARGVLSPTEFDSVVRASFTSHIHTHPSEFYYCPTPDCPQVYRKAPRDTVLQCPSCLTRICPNCHVTYHQGKFCPDPDTEDTKLFDEWTKKHDVKQCPGCKAPIERAEGCNHMNCARCKAHICWVCLKTFAASKSVYDHMFAEHGGIGL